MSCTCQHVLAVKLAQALDSESQVRIQEKVIDEVDFQPLLMEGKMQMLKCEEKRVSGPTFARH